MKKYLPLLVLLISPFFVEGQSCTPDQSLNQPGYYPNQLADGSAGASYSETIQFVIPQDTQVMYMGGSVNATIDSIKVVEVLGLPSNLTYVCNPSSCALPGGQTSCGNIYGTIDSAESGSFPIMIPVIFYVRIGGSFPVQQKDTLKNFAIDVMGPNALPGISYKKLLVYPNPTHSNARLLLTEDASAAKVSLYTASGRQVEVLVKTDGREIELTTENLEAGIYYGTVRTEKHIYRFKIIRR